MQHYLGVAEESGVSPKEIEMVIFTTDDDGRRDHLLFRGDAVARGRHARRSPFGGPAESSVPHQTSAMPEQNDNPKRRLRSAKGVRVLLDSFLQIYCFVEW